MRISKHPHPRIARHVRMDVPPQHGSVACELPFSSCGTRMDRVLARRREPIRGLSCRGSRSPRRGCGRVAATPWTRSASARRRSRLPAHPMQDDERIALRGASVHRLPPCAQGTGCWGARVGDEHAGHAGQVVRKHAGLRRFDHTLGCRCPGAPALSSLACGTNLDDWNSVTAGGCGP
jgi:hypothetical protein